MIGAAKDTLVGVPAASTTVAKADHVRIWEVVRFMVGDVGLSSAWMS